MSTPPWKERGSKAAPSSKGRALRILALVSAASPLGSAFVPQHPPTTPAPSARRPRARARGGLGPSSSKARPGEWPRPGPAKAEASFAGAGVGTLLAAQLTAEQEHAKEVFDSVDKEGSGTISPTELGEMLRMLDIDATDDDADALFKYLDAYGSGAIGFDEFLPWYSDAADAAKESAATFQGVIVGRRTVHQFDRTPVSDDVLRRAVKCAISAPNRSGSEPWRFISLGPDTVAKIADLNRKQGGDEGSFTRWTSIPGWCVVTCKKTPGNPDAEQEDFKSTCCAVQNFMLSMWSEGIGSKWTSGPVQRTPEFAELCGIDSDEERVTGVIWFGFARGGLISVEPKQRRKGVDQVLSDLP